MTPISFSILMRRVVLRMCRLRSSFLRETALATVLTNMLTLALTTALTLALTTALILVFTTALTLVFLALPAHVFQSSLIHGQNRPAPTDRYWQQEVDYTMEIDMDAETNRFSGVQTLRYMNHSPDTLSRVFYHLFFNAFQPGSMMDKRSRTIEDPDRRVRDRIFSYGDAEIGYQQVRSLKHNGEAADYRVEGTILEVMIHILVSCYHMYLHVNDDDVFYDFYDDS